ncbi:transcriptional regulator, MerR family [Legionella busanensis]|uniref:Transcriptional regulator, MerR family n=1 Tax=Legionella busanensis TaxID=190655 RepID=A0A378JN35_9GAMM|nr:MerR family DNA-binding protein [Legionella busanensis]STX52131.1 transcriptional regulator, MerR family [Legionella busanensis]
MLVSLIPNIPPRIEEFSSKKIRRYGEQDISRLQFILSAKKAGFTLKEIKELLELDAQNDRERVRGIAQNRIAKIDIQILELKEARNALYHLIKECKKTDSKPCPILTAFVQK